MGRHLSNYIYLLFVPFILLSSQLHAQELLLSSETIQVKDYHWRIMDLIIYLARLAKKNLNRLKPHCLNLLPESRLNHIITWRKN